MKRKIGDFAVAPVSTVHFIYYCNAMSMNLGISTAWQSAQLDDGHLLLDRMAATGLDALEIDYRITGAMLRDMRPRLQTGEFRILTVHNYCPLPDGFDKAESMSILNLASLDEEERRTAVRSSCQTLRLAAELGARLVVFHLGKLDSIYDTDELFSFYDNDQLETQEFRQWLAQKMALRARLAEKQMPQLLRSVEILNQEALRCGVLVGAENRYRFSQLPWDGEFDVLFREFDGGALRYWHDLGHAEIYSRLKIADHLKDYLLRWQNHLAGFHLHDVQGLQDHLAPGSGDFDFNLLKPFMKADTLRILEIHHRASLGEIQKSVRMLKEKNLV